MGVARESEQVHARHVEEMVMTTETSIVKGFKAFKNDLSCRGHKFKVGESYKINGQLQICGNGFHFCEQLKDVYNYYERSYDTRICMVEAHGEVIKDGDKSCTSEIFILAELDQDEIKRLTDDLRFNSGDYNSGDYNSGDYNSGNRNSGDYNSGYFNSNTPKVRIFNRESDMAHDDQRIYRLNSIITNYWKPHFQWIYSGSMTEEEKAFNPSHTTTGGFLRFDQEYGYKKSWEHVWNKCSEDEKEFIKSLPNFDAEVFFEITGVLV
jgi:hypothetical protein